MTDTTGPAMVTGAGNPAAEKRKNPVISMEHPGFNLDGGLQLSSSSRQHQTESL